ncbi:MAG: hypothetical protein IPK87_13180 [Planctomycetes bacterium]|nr:hypothetical protein [Planctomycetota bacterium]
MKSTIAMALAAAMLLSICGVAETTLAQDKPAKNKLPWTAEDARKSWGKGITYRFMVLKDDHFTDLVDIDFWDVSEKGYSTRTNTRENGEFWSLGSDKKVSWDGLLTEYGEMIKDGEAKEVGNVKTVYSRWGVDCTRYTMQKEHEGETITTTVWLSKEFPGVFVKAEYTSVANGRTYSETWSMHSVGLPQADRPWSDEKVAETWKDGSTIVFSNSTRKEWDGLEPVVISTETTQNITGAAWKGLIVSVTEKDVNGEEKRTPKTELAWRDFFAFYIPSRIDTSKADEKIKVAGGEFECVKYTHTYKEKSSSVCLTTWWSKDKPGLLVKHVRTFTLTGAPPGYGESLEVVVELKEYKFGK